MVFALQNGHMHCSDAVPAGMPQTASSAESWAAIQAVRLAHHGTNLLIITDCALVVARIQKGWMGVRSGGRGTGLWKQFLQITADRDISVQVRKTKAHRTYAQAVAGNDLQNNLGNDAADKAAARGAQV
jgi:ribonuclease HI